MLKTFVAIVALAVTTGACHKKSDKPTSSERVPESSEGQMWMLGEKLALAALGQANGVADASNQNNLKLARTVADITLQAKVDDLPAKTGDRAKDDAEILHYLLDGSGRQLGAAAREKYGATGGASYELAIKVALISLLYIDDPADKMADSLARTIGRLAQEAKLPDDVCGPLIAKLEARAPQKEVLDTAIALIKHMPEVLAKLYEKSKPA